MDHIEKQGYWTIDSLSSEVVEFSGCHFDGKTLKPRRRRRERGRFFYDAGFYSAEHWQDKSIRFIQWAEILFRAAKHCLKRVSSLDAYAGEDAERWRSEGGIFIQLAIKGQPPQTAK